MLRLGFFAYVISTKISCTGQYNVRCFPACNLQKDRHNSPMNPQGGVFGGGSPLLGQ